MKVSKGKRDIQTGEKKKKRNKEQNADVETHVTVNNEVDHGMQVIKENKLKVSTKLKRKNKSKNLVGGKNSEHEVNKGERDIQTMEKKKKRSREQNADVETHVTVNNEVNHGMRVIKEKKVKVSTKQKRKNKNKNLVPESEEVNKEKRDIRTGEKKKKRSREQRADVETHVTVNNEVEMQVMKEKKAKVSNKRKRKNKHKHLVGKQTPEVEEVDLEEENVASDEVVGICHSKTEEVKGSKENRDSCIGAVIKPCKSKETKKKRKKEIQNSPEKGENHQDETHIISSGDDDCSNGMKKWIMEYHQSRPGLEALQRQIDGFVTVYEEKLEEERKAKEALAGEGGWTVVVHHKGRKKTTDSESGIAVGSVAQAAVENNVAKKKRKEVGLDFYRFQKREAQRNEIMVLQGKFEEDKKRLQQLRAARKFRPY